MESQRCEEKHICYDCIGDQLLAEEVKTQGEVAHCSYCGECLEAFGLDKVADRIHEVLEKHFIRTSSEDNYLDSIFIGEGQIKFWATHGDPVELVIAETAGLDEAPASDLRDLLSGRYAYWAVKEGVEDPYDNEAYYQSCNPNDWGLRYDWREFCEEIMFKERFFPKNAEPTLNKIFGNLESLTTSDGSPVVREISPGDETLQIWRARIAHSVDELKTILINPPEGLGPPPPTFAEVGRMNAKGVSVFYGAMDKSTCVAEVRPPVGSHVVLGRFEFSRSVRLLDLEALTKVYSDTSYFDPNCATDTALAMFIRNLAIELSRPIMAQDVDREYLPTQFVASYLANRVDPRLDGMIFPSAQSTSNSQNLVLFNHARGVESYEIPDGTESKVYIHSAEDDSILISETIPQEATEEHPARGKEQRGPIRSEELLKSKGQEPDPTLRLDIDSLDVSIVKSVRYECDTRTVRRHRKKEGEHDPLSANITDWDPNEFTDPQQNRLDEEQF